MNCTSTMISMLKTLFQLILILCGTAFVIFIGFSIFFVSVMGGFDKDYSVSELVENFKENKTAIYELKEHFNEIVPHNTSVAIEFDSDNSLSRLGITTYDSITDKLASPEFLEWDLAINSKYTDSVIKPLGWTRETLKILKEKLDKANCIYIETGEPIRIGFQRSGMGMYFFNVFHTSIPDSLNAYYNDSCTYIRVNDQLVLEYGGGAIGQQCFYNLE